MIRRLTLIATLVALVGLATAPAVSAQPPVSSTAIPASFDLPGGGEITGIQLTDIGLENGQLVASGILSGTTAAGMAFTEAFTDLVIGLTNPDGGACDILFLDLGPLFLDVLGLTVDLSAIQLDINAVPGAGNLLGNLLCAVAGLLDGPGLGNALTNLLGIINRLLG